MASGAPPDGELRSWKEIADHLGVNVRTAQKWEVERGLPVRRMGGTGRVFVLTSELEFWKQTGVMASLSGARPRFWRWYTVVTTVLLAGAAAYIAGQAIQASRRGPPALFRVELDTLFVSDSAGRPLWLHRFSAAFHADAFLSVEGNRRIWFGDLDGDRRVETLAVHLPQAVDALGSTLYCFDEKGRRKWSYSVERTVSDGRQSYSPRYLISGFRVEDLGMGGGRRVVLSARHPVFHPNLVALLDTGGRTAAEYWHSGHLDFMDTADLDGDGVKELLLAGVNNGLAAAVLVVLDPRRMAGASSQPPGHPLGIRSLAPARERAVVVFPRTCINRKFAAYNMARYVRAEEGAIRLTVFERIDDDHTNVIVVLDRNLNLAQFQFSDALRALHLRLEREGALDHTIDADERAWRLGYRVLRNPGSPE
jgi:hypothetical protein